MPNKMTKSVGLYQSVKKPMGNVKKQVMPGQVLQAKAKSALEAKKKANSK